MNPAAPQPTIALQLRAIVNHRGVQIAAALWIASYGLVLLLDFLLNLGQLLGIISC